MKDRIAVNPQIHFGKPCVAGTRIPVQSVLELVREGIGFAEIIHDYYPDLQTEDIRACVQYAIDVVAAEDIHLATTPRTFSQTRTFGRSFTRSVSTTPRSDNSATSSAACFVFPLRHSPFCYRPSWPREPTDARRSS